MDRPSRRYGYLAVILSVVAGTISAGGCQSALVTALWLTKGTNVAAEYGGLREKKVVVVCRTLADLKYRDASVAKDLARQISALLQRNVPKIEVVDQRKVTEWTDENSWEEYPEIGKALDADMVVGIDLEGFTIYQGQTLYQGKATASMKVYDCAGDGQPVFTKELPQMVYPPNTGVPTSDRVEAEFRREFVQVLADQIGRYFYEHDPHADYAMDAMALR